VNVSAFTIQESKKENFHFAGEIMTVLNIPRHRYDHEKEFLISIADNKNIKQVI
jgi:hypothetical protein